MFDRLISGGESSRQFASIKLNLLFMKDMERIEDKKMSLGAVKQFSSVYFGSNIFAFSLALSIACLVLDSCRFSFIIRLRILFKSTSTSTL